ncbi:MAG: hypothetical protein CVV24_01600 [Ignavibacteriae bacterium HGW-Ignavibacteriae-3]|nr:MAG: hypothetical protein CVV24_01600 [Ignavibacteriae bacterium HGW-Ignavibacteriae-3]
MTELTPQQKAALTFDKHISVTANAGSGKTFVLSKRFVEIFLNNDVDLGSIVAITFTDKAAGELNKKIAFEIDERIMAESEPGKKRKLQNLRRQLVSANISTIHSFCINILREFAPEAEIDANFHPIDKAASDELIELSIEDVINSLILNSEYNGDLRYLIRFFSSKKLFLSQLKSAIERRRVIQQISDGLYSESEEKIALYLNDKFEDEFNRIFSKIIDDLVLSIGRINEYVLNENPDNKHGLETEYVLNLIRPVNNPFQKLLALRGLVKNSLTNDLTVRKTGYLHKGRELFEDDCEFIRKSFSELGGFLIADETGKSYYELAVFGKAFIRIYNYTLNLYSARKKKNGYLDFEDLLILTHKILSLENVIKQLSEKFRYIMIDEYQDTNELQYEIIMPILNHLKRGNLFVVGDEKQSIYLFRNAELEIFERTKMEIEQDRERGELLNLPHSFRMAPQLVLFTNHLFNNLFKNPSAYFNEVSHSNLVCAKEESEPGEVEILLTESQSENKECNHVAYRIARLIKENKLDYKNIAVLCRKRSSFFELEEAFAANGIPFTIIGGKGFYQRQTIYDVYNYLTFLLNEENDSALIGILRSPFFNISDLQLYEISLEEGDSFFEKMEQRSKSSSEIKSVVDELKKFVKASPGMEISSLVRKLLLESGYWAVIAAKQNAPQELANIEKLLTLARSYTKKSFKNLYDFTVFLKEAIEGFEDEGQAQVARDENTVKILTIHQAKGLEYKAVFLYGCNDTTQDDSVRAKSLSADKNFGMLAKVPIQLKYFEKYSTPPIVALYNYVSERKNRAELKRLLYVGVTRAINYLFISATCKEMAIKKNSFLELISEGLNTDLIQNEIVLDSDVEFIKYDVDSFSFPVKKISLKIPIVNQVEIINFDKEGSDEVERPKLNLTGKISDKPGKEIISATKISMFTQCPVKYQLTYELGYSRIYDLIKNKNSEYEFNSNEDEELRQFAQNRGKIIHSALKEGYRDADLRKFVERRVELENTAGNVILNNKLVEAIIVEIESYYSSDTYRKINSHPDSKNEFEVYCGFGEHYLYGIIDKLLIENNRLVIIDYKTDNVKNEQLISRASDYLPQLQFYAYILSKLYKEINSYELRIIFLKNPENPVSYNISLNDLTAFGDELELAVTEIFSEQFKPNLNHCSKCHFAQEGDKCVKVI